MILDNLGNRFSELGQHEEALDRGQEAVGIWRELARQRPDAYSVDLAGSLSNLATRLNVLGRHEEALRPAQEAIELFEGLAEQRPDAFSPDLARSLGALCTTLSRLGRPREAAEAFEAGLRTVRDAFLIHPRVFARMLDSLLCGYRQEAKKAGVTPAMDILAPLNEALANLQHDELSNSVD